MPHAGGRPLKFKTPEEIQQKADKYFKDCGEKEKPITITGLALALETSRETLINYEKKDEFFDVIKKVKLVCENYAEDRMFQARNPAGPIFALKNYGWRDRQETDITTGGKPIFLPGTLLKKRGINPITRPDSK